MNALANLVSSAIATAQQILIGVLVPPVPSPVPLQRQRLSFTADVVRADDLLVLGLEFYNLALDAGTHRLQAAGAGDAFVAVRLPAQHVVEQAFKEGASDDQVGAPPVAARLSGESRLVFHLAPALLPLDFSVEAVLGALARCAPLVRDRSGAPPSAPAPGADAWFGGLSSQFTAIEAPWRLVLSPHPQARWAHASVPVAGGVDGATELWHTRLGVVSRSDGEVDERAPSQRTARAVHSPDHAGSDGPVPTDGPSPFLASLTRQDRHELVRITSERSLRGNAPVAVEQLILSAFGASMRLDGAWNVQDLSLVRWQHRATLGRDQFVKTVRKGFLFPCGHRAALIRIAERKLAAAPGGWTHAASGHAAEHPSGLYAYLRVREFIVVREPVKNYGHRHFPFKHLAFHTRVTPILSSRRYLDGSPAGDGNDPDPPERAFWPMHEEGGPERDVVFDVEGTDREGRGTRFGVRQIFVFDSGIANPPVEQIVDAYNGAAGPLQTVPEAQRSSELQLQRLAYALPQAPGDTALDTERLTLGALKASGTPRFLPALASARVIIPAVREVTGAGGASTIRYDEAYLGASASQFGNAGEVFARIDGGNAGIAFPVQKVGGLVAPDLTPQGVSRRFGPVGDADAFASGSFDPGAIFQGVKILGGLPLDLIFRKVPFSWPDQAGGRVPGLGSIRTERDLGSGPEPVVETSYRWQATAAELQQQPIFLPGPSAQFALDAVIATPQDGGEPVFEVSGKLEDFEIVLPPGDTALVGARFDHVRFSAGSGRKLDVSVQFDDIVFKGDLEFVNKIREYVPLDGFIDPPYLDITDEGVKAGYSLGVPMIGIGIFVLQDISLGAGFHLPFVGGAAGLRFAFCERDHPFLLTVMAFGGGGFFALEMSTSEVTNIEAALEFGAAVAINLGVAAGKASITGGVYYKRSTTGFELSAYFRAAGSLSVLGIVTVSVELYVGLKFISKQGGQDSSLYGTATVKVKIKIAFFSTSVSISVERKLAGSDPAFAQMVSPAQWNEYCAAFAPEAV
ncbi:hypothetical protein [Luteimonas saliphila]|uniref:hypothetical protein n=1 Tax=Luteimonas saliphila TaxID=2804919 RepID=UPI00192D8CE2|nr:hypothetical protein [Luteimonas saliphila]